MTLGAVDFTAVSVRLLSLMAVLQTCGLVLFIVLYARYLRKALAPIVLLATVSAVVGATLTVIYQALVAARLAGDFSGLWNLSLLSITWQSAAGVAAIVRVAGMSAILVAVRRNGKSIALIGVALTVVSFPMSGHTVTHEPKSVLAILLIVHVTIAAYWFGSLPALALAVKYDSAVRAVTAFSRHAMSIVPILALAGLGMAWVFLPKITALSTPYGIAIAGKANGFALLMLIAALNKYRWMPAMQRGDARAAIAFRRTVMVEYAVVAAVLAVATLLTTLLSPV